jgi:hypothetical protein
MSHERTLRRIFLIIVLEVNTEKTKYKLLSRHQNAGQSYGIKIANKSFEMWQSSDIWEQL